MYPPFSGLEPTEKWLDEAPIRQQAGKGTAWQRAAQSAVAGVSFAFRGSDGRIARAYTAPPDWKELADIVERWFSV